MIEESLEIQYLRLLERVLDEGVFVSDRTGVGSKAVFDGKLVCCLEEFPFSTIRSMSPRLAFEEFWFFLNGKTQTKELEERGCNFWKANTSREFLDKRGLTYLDEGDMGAAYGSQLRNYGYDTSEMEYGVDQLCLTYETLAKDRYSRRIYNTMWNPNESHLMALTPCWHSHQFVVLPNKKNEDVLHLKLVNRSLDTLFGAMFAIQQYRMYQIALASLLGFKVGELSCDLTHIHLYENQLEYTEELLTRSFEFETSAYNIERIRLKRELTSLEDLLSLTWDDWEVDMPTVNENKFDTPRPPMAA